MFDKSKRQKQLIQRKIVACQNQQNQVTDKELSAQEEIFWNQCSKVHWLQCGDLNTIYFHLSTSSCKKVNFIHKLQNVEVTWVTEPIAINLVVLDYFSSLFAGSPCNFEEFLHCVPTKVTVEDNTKLLCPFGDEEFCKACSKWELINLQALMR